METDYQEHLKRKMFSFHFSSKLDGSVCFGPEVRKNMAEEHVIKDVQLMTTRKRDGDRKRPGKICMSEVHPGDLLSLTRP